MPSSRRESLQRNSRTMISQGGGQSEVRGSWRRTSDRHEPWNSSLATFPFPRDQHHCLNPVGSSRFIRFFGVCFFQG